MKGNGSDLKLPQGDPALTSSVMIPAPLSSQSAGAAINSNRDEERPSVTQSFTFDNKHRMFCVARSRHGTVHIPATLIGRKPGLSPRETNLNAVPVVSRRSRTPKAGAPSFG